MEPSKSNLFAGVVLILVAVVQWARHPNGLLGYAALAVGAALIAQYFYRKRKDGNA